MMKKKKFKMGQKAVCKSCDKEIEYVGSFWRHTPYSTCHIAVPKDTDSDGQSGKNDRANLEETARRLEAKPGDVIALKAEYRENFTRTMDEIMQYFPEGTLIIFVDDLEDIRTLNEEEMRRFGWMRNSD